MATQIKKTKSSKKLSVGVQLLNSDGVMPLRKRSSDAGYDIHASEKIIIPGHTTKPVKTGIALDLPKGYFAKIFDRSGVALNTSLIVKAGVVDNEYTGEVGIIIANVGPYPETILKGDRIAQFLLLPVPEFNIKEVKTIKKTTRGSKGFGSSGR